MALNIKKALVLASTLVLAACSCDEGMTASMKSMQHDLEANAASKIYFETNIPRPGHLTLNAEQTACARTVAEWLLKDKHLKVALILEGHCDERGTVEYNMALGERRATAVKHAIAQEYHALSGKALDTHRVDIISFGKENNPTPNKEGLTYAEWLAKNRVVLVKVKEVN